MFSTITTLVDLLVSRFGWLQAGLPPRRRAELRLFVLRHAEAVKGGGVADDERPLTERGRADASRLGGMLATHGLSVDAVISSPARRATETATLFARALGYRGSLQRDPRLCGQGVDGIRAVVREIAGDTACVVVVSHDPAISRFVETVAGAPVSVPPGGLADITISATRWTAIAGAPTAARLTRLWRPSQPAASAMHRPGPRAARASPKWFESRIDERLVDAASRAVEQRLESLLARLDAVADVCDEDGEAVRKLRVAVRREEAALRTFREVLPRRAATHVREHLRAIRNATDASRDADMVLSRVASLADETLLATLEADRRAARHEVRALCRRVSGDPALARSAAVLLRKSREARYSSGVEPERIAPWARARLDRSTNRFLTATVPDPDDLAALHELRLRTKKLRYEVEILAGALPPRVRAEAYPILTGLQDRLGEINDGAVLRERLQGISGSGREGMQQGVLDTLLCEADALLERARADFAAWWTPGRVEQLRLALRSAE